MNHYKLNQILRWIMTICGIFVAIICYIGTWFIPDVSIWGAITLNLIETFLVALVIKEATEF